LIRKPVVDRNTIRGDGIDEIQDSLAVAWYVVLALALLITGCGSTKTENQATSSHSLTKTSAAKMVATAVNGDLHVSMLDVGQADATLIQYKGKTMLIDTGDPDHRDTLVKDLKDRNIKEIDTIIITHPHGDHLGGMAALFKTLPFIRFMITAKRPIRLCIATIKKYQG
jgi:beta-lactamase superfamily II metal-dependent hydrolase